MATTEILSRQGPYHRDDLDLPASPRVYKIGDRVSDARFLKDGIHQNHADPELNTSLARAEGRFAAFDKNGDLMRFFHDPGTHSQFFAVKEEGVDFNPVSVLNAHGSRGVVYVVLFTRAQMAEFLVRYDGAKIDGGRGRPTFEFDTEPPVRVLELPNPFTGKTEPAFVLIPEPEFKGIAKHLDGLLTLRKYHRTSDAINFVVCQDRVNITLAEHLAAKTDEEADTTLEAHTAAVASYTALISPEVRAIHGIATEPANATLRRSETHEMFLLALPNHIKALETIAAREAE